MLFGPANRVDFVPKFVQAGADIGVLDLEDAVAETAKSEAREALSEGRPGAGDLGDTVLFVRVNSLDTDHFTHDLVAAAEAQAVGIIVPKIESADMIREIRGEMGKRALGNAFLCAGIESAAGVHHSAEICDAHIDLVYFGAEDFITDMGGVRTESNTEVLYARSKVALAARLSSRPALDQIVADFGDATRFTREALNARAMGYSGKLCIHPSQVALANDAFLPSVEEVAWATAVIAAVEHADGAALVSFEGTMVDTPLILRAQRILDSAEAPADS